MELLTALLGTTPAIFIGLTVVLVGGAAILTGRAVASNWKPAWQVVASCFGLALADRFLTYALFQGELVNLWGIIVALRRADGDGSRVVAHRPGRQAGEPVSVALPADLAVRLRGVERCVMRHRAGADRANAACQASAGPRIIPAERSGPEATAPPGPSNV